MVLFPVSFKGHFSYTKLFLGSVATILRLQLQTDAYKAIIIKFISTHLAYLEW